MAKKLTKKKLVKDVLEALGALLMFDEDGTPPKEDKPKGKKGGGKKKKKKKKDDEEEEDDEDDDEEDDEDDDEDDDEEEDDDDEDQPESGRAPDQDAAPDEKGIDHLNRKALLKYIKRKRLKVDTKGKTVGDLRKAIAKAEKPPGSKRALKVLQDRLAETIEEHDAEVAEMIEDLGCGGDCYKCPHPEKRTVRAQVKACVTAVHEELELELPKKVAKALARA